MESPELPPPKWKLWRWLLLVSLLTVVMGSFVWWRVRSESIHYLEPLFVDAHCRVVKPTKDTDGLNGLRKIGEMCSLTRKSGFVLSGRGVSYEFEAQYPDFTTSNQFHQAVSRLLLTEVRLAASETPDVEWSSWWEAIKDDVRDVSDVSMSFEMLVVSDQAVSLREMLYEYSGGAHGNYSSHGRNFVEQDGGSHEIKLNELFDGGEWPKIVSDLCVADLQRQGAAWVQPAADETFRVTEFEAESLTFALLPSGIVFYFAPYVAGPYSDGEFEVLLPYEKLTDHLRPAGPHRLFQAEAQLKTR